MKAKNELAFRATSVPIEQSNKKRWVHPAQDIQLRNEFIDVLSSLLHGISERDVSSAGTSNEGSSVL